MAFHDIRLPDDIERGAVGGPRFKTTVIALSSGHEKRNELWEQTRGAWDIGYGLRKKADYEETINFFYARRGQAHGFRFKDWTDYEINDQFIGFTDGMNDQFQIFKQYDSGAYDFKREITKIVEDTISVTVDGTPVVQGIGNDQFTVNLTTGIILFGSTIAATNNQPVNVTCEFDVPVRFATDALDITAEVIELAVIPSIPVVEIRA